MLEFRDEWKGPRMIEAASHPPDYCMHFAPIARKNCERAVVSIVGKEVRNRDLAPMFRSDGLSK